MINLNVHNLSIDFSSVSSIQADFKLKQFAYGNDSIEASLLFGGAAFDPTADYTEASVRFIRPDGRFDERYIWKKDDEAFSGLTVSDGAGKLSFTICPFEVYSAGSLQIEFILYALGEDVNIKTKIISPAINIDVYKSISSYNVITKESIDIIDVLISEVKALQVTVNYEEYINMLEKAKADIALNSSDIGRFSDLLNSHIIETESYGRDIVELSVASEHHRTEIDDLHTLEDENRANILNAQKDIADLQIVAEENKGEEVYDAKSKKAQSGIAVAQAIAAIVDSAPETLNTLEELAKALGNDPNFATTIMSLLGKKVDNTSFEKEAGLFKESLNKKVDKEDGKGLSSNDFTDDEKSDLAEVVEHAISLEENKADAFALEAHTSNTDNPHSVTKSQIGLGNADNTSDMDKPISNAVREELDSINNNIARIDGIVVDKADKADTLVGYGITNAYTKDEVTSLINTAIGEALEGDY